mmetsp:Transcript_30055/g.58984  ORF Transcript_30055/g.58984 Transcript_30055/m.58984 type:complete len:1069 (-) Transcript_30055:264-3470(-)
MDLKFVAKVAQAMKTVKLLLHAEKRPIIASNVHHQYQDKYLLAEFLVNSAVASQLNCLIQIIGISEEQLAQLGQWSSSGIVSLRLRSEETCTFLREETREIEGPTHKQELSIGERVASAFSSKVVTNITEYFWKFTVSYDLIAFRGVGAELGDQLRISGRTASQELKTSRKVNPRPESRIPAVCHDVNMNWLFKSLAADSACPAFTIDRDHKGCKTPRRNADVEKALDHFSAFQGWCGLVSAYMDSLFAVDANAQQVYSFRKPAVFVPVLPLFEASEGDACANSSKGEEAESSDEDVSETLFRFDSLARDFEFTDTDNDHNRLAMHQNRLTWFEPDEAGGWKVWQQGPCVLDRQTGYIAIDDGKGFATMSLEDVARFEKEQKEVRLEATGPITATVAGFPETRQSLESMLLSSSNVNKFLAEELRGLTLCRDELARALSNRDAVATAIEGTLRATTQHLMAVGQQLMQALDFVEAMLRTQLIAAIGKEVTPTDFAEYVRFHGQRLFRDQFLPIPFCFAVRRSSHHTPEGILSVEEAGVRAEPILTMVCQSLSTQPMQFPLSASTNVTFGGERFLHAWLRHSFSSELHGRGQLSLVARARQFSSFLVLAGRVTSATTFDPMCAVIVQNRDELTIPLEASTIPTPKEFKDAIASLSPEMQAFAKSFRAMQLESTLLGIVVIQIRPQLEKVLNLAPESLIKEIKLTQDLMQLFVEYQIPVDLLAFDSTAASGDFRVGGSVSPAEKVELVKHHVKAINTMISEAKAEELEQRRKEEEARHKEMEISRLAEMRQELMMRDEAPRERARKKGGMMLGCKKKSAMPSLGMSRNRASAFAVAESAPLLLQSAAEPQQQAQQHQQASAEAASAPLSEFSLKPQKQAQQQQQQQQQKQQQQHPEQQPQSSSGTATDPKPVELRPRDFTEVPKELDACFEMLDEDGALRPTIITPGNVWTMRRKKQLLADFTTSTWREADQKRERNAAFDLLDALTKSGALSLDHASLHVLVAATHTFDKSVTETVVRDSVNPIDKVERSMLIMASTVQELPPAALLNPALIERVKGVSPKLFALENAR